jgi:hypothetical protein
VKAGVWSCTRILSVEAALVQTSFGESPCRFEFPTSSELLATLIELIPYRTSNGSTDMISVPH